MCGINGIFAFNRSANLPISAELHATRDYMHRRGPDGCSEWWSNDRRLGLGHRRLAIIDLSDRALQPMMSADGRFVIVFNGEIYNYKQLRDELAADGVTFQTASDTEALLILYARHGQKMVSKLRGMFALAIWDNKRRGLFLARDPYGIKPLYTASDGWTFRFASQVKALRAGGQVSREPEPAGIVGFHLWGSVPEPHTLYRDIRALPAGHTQWIDAAGAREPRGFASIAQALAEGASKPADKKELLARVRSATLDSVQAHLVADVEVGLFLSAGVDSGALLGLMRDAGQGRIRAITIAFDEFRGSPEDEVPLAKQLAAHYGAEHTVIPISRRDFERDIHDIIRAMDQPSIDGVNTWFVAKAAHSAGLKVALSGLGGDELLAGYPSFRDIPNCVRWLGAPSAIPGAGVAARWIMRAAGLGGRTPKALGLLEFGGTYPGAYLLRRALYLPFELRDLLDPELVRTGLRRLSPLRALKQSVKPDPRTPVSRVTALESANYMRNQLLRDADWAGMAHSLEIRTPLVDYQLLRTLAPSISSLRHTALGKYALAAAPSAPLPDAITSRPKTGFGVPTGRWIGRATQVTATRKGAASRAWSKEVFAAQHSTHDILGAAD
jgi:asparagine synthase (glutamine-hydrolysing)